MDIECIYCNALHWPNECLTSSSHNCPKFGTCCSHAHAFTSLGAKNDQSVFNDHELYSFRISGKLYHHIGSLLPDSDAEATYAQLYIYDSEIAHQLKMERNESLSPNIIGPLQQIHEGHLAYLPLHYVLFFPHRELGWHPDLRHTPTNIQRQSSENQSNILHLTQLEFYTFQLFSWHNEFSTILHDRKLFQEFIVDAWAITEQNRLRFLHINQNTLCANLYQSLTDIVGNNSNEELFLNNIG
ncbi:6809_t:CDS:2 [Cetraspora pellucida]|uniref:6809_t:CDS:1 n=1 Tax=Cetraspora pellucida TaxID=1433469 RepID=A0ACA9K265_9GLOM|nr:6809_t:CDS:2 [Cetraspora pellucida]